ALLPSTDPQDTLSPGPPAPPADGTAPRGPGSKPAGGIPAASDRFPAGRSTGATAVPDLRGPRQAGPAAAIAAWSFLACVDTPSASEHAGRLLPGDERTARHPVATTLLPVAPS